MSRSKIYMDKRVEQGLCDRCGKPAVDGMRRCNLCGIKHRIAERERRNCMPFPVIGVGREWKYEGEEL